MRKHGGKRTVFLNFFLKKKRNIKILSNLKLSEQGTRFLEKHNRNILIEIKNINIPKKSNFCWLTKTNLKHLLQKKNILNMDTISVLSSVIKKNKIDNPFENFSKINLKLNKFKKDFQLKRSLIKFTNLEGWKIQDYSIYDLKKKFFSIFFINIKANTREVKTWDQPIISDHFISLNGFLVCKINNTLHYLLNLKFEPGFKSPKYTSTISEKNFLYKNIKKIKYYNFFKKKNYLLNIINSDEGGRFFKNQSKNIICKLKNYNKLNLSKNYTWVSHNQLIKLINQNKITIEARNLFASYNIDKIR